MRARVGSLMAGAVLVALLLVCFARLVAHPGALVADGRRPSVDYLWQGGPRGLGNDLTCYWLPRFQMASAQLATAGRIPFWDASGFAGRPFLGNPQAGLFYPPVWLAWYSGAPASLGWLTVAHLLWGGIGAYRLARMLRIRRVGAVVSAGCFEAAPFVLAHTFEGHYPHVWSACWYPWAFLAFFHYRQGAWRGGLALPPILACAFLTGHPQEWYYLVLALSLWTAIDLCVLLRRGEFGPAARRAATWAGIVAVSVGLVGVELGPIRAAHTGSMRAAGVSAGKASRYGMHSVNLWQLVSPRALGGPSDYIGHENYWEQLLGFGLVPLLLAACALGLHPDRRRVGAFLALAVTATVFAAGRRLGLFLVLYRFVPGMSAFRVPSRSLFLANLGWALLAGLGVEAIGRFGLPAGQARALRRSVVVLAAVALLGLAGARLVTLRPEAIATGEPHRGRVAAARLARDGLVVGLLAAGLSALWLAGRTPRFRPMAAAALGALALLELGWYGHALLKVASPERFLGRDPISDALVQSAPPVRGPFRISASDALYDDLSASTHRFEKIKLNDWYQVQRTADLYEALYPFSSPLDAPAAGDRLAEALRIADVLGVAFVVADHVEPRARWPVVARGQWRGKDFVIQRNATALPRAYVVPRGFEGRGTPAEARSLLRQFDPRAAVLMERDPLGPGGPRQPFTPAEWAPCGPDQVRASVTTQAPGLLVVADTWYPGWSARVDGERAPILRGNHALRVVPLYRPGRHEIVMTYRPPGLARGVALSLASALLWAVGAAAGWARSRRGAASVAGTAGPHYRQYRDRVHRPGTSAQPPLKHTIAATDT